MKKNIVFIGSLTCIYLFTTLGLRAQTPNPTSAKVVFFELGGPGLVSVNYDARFGKKADGLGFRAGIGGFSSFGGGLLAFPLGLNYIASKDDRNFFEIGAGPTILSTKGDGSGDELFMASFAHLTFGYRLQPKNGGFVFKAALNPIITDGGFFPFYGGVAFGWKF